MGEADLIRERRRKIDELRRRGIDPYGCAFARENMVSDVTDDSGPVTVAGRISALRLHGKAAFADLQDLSGTIQVYFQKGAPELDYDLFDLLDIGDIVGLSGEPFRTRTGQLTLKARHLALLAKAQRPLPGKWHGLKEVETRSRQRYLDLVANRSSRDVFIRRSRMVSECRRFLDDRGFMEVETPMMHTIVGGAAARPFVTRHNALDMDLYLRVAPELFLKRLLVGGLEKVYELNRSFRNEGISTMHNPEFTMLEVYAAYGDYRLMAGLAEEMVVHLLGRCRADGAGGLKVSFGGREIDCAPPWRRVTLADLAREHLGVHGWRDLPGLEAAARRHGLETAGGETGVDLLDALFERVIQPCLEAPTFVLDYPEEVSPLAKAKPGCPGVVERFELFVAGMEIGNAYSELNDPDEQRRRFEAGISRAGGGHRVVDEDYLAALAHGMPPAGGLGIGIDRLAMFLADSASIREVILFPILKPDPQHERRKGDPD